MVKNEILIKHFIDKKRNIKVDASEITGLSIRNKKIAKIYYKDKHFGLVVDTSDFEVIRETEKKGKEKLT
jgi:hypothetical protein